MRKKLLTEKGLTLKEVQDFLCTPSKWYLSESAKKKIQASRTFVESKLADSKPYYGINTGFGKLATVSIPKDKINLIQKNILYSHAISVGEPIPKPIVKLLLLLHAASLARGFSGVRVEVVQGLLNLLNNDLLPWIPQKGSLGASGDLALLAHVGLVLMGEGFVFDGEKKEKTATAFQKRKLKPLSLLAKEGLSLVNGLTASLAYALFALFRAEKLIKLSDIVAAASIEGDQGSFQPFDKKVLNLRPHAGILKTGENLRKLLKKSEINLKHLHCGRVQDPYSFRCIPQVHGAVKETFQFVKSSLETELTSVTDNPLVFEEEAAILSGGNFHGESIAFACDFLTIAMAELGALSERRFSILVNPIQGEIPTFFLTKDPGIHSGLMTPHYVVTNLVLENKTLCTPASIDSLPTSGGQEDHVSQSCWAAQKLNLVLENLEKVLSIELWAASRAIQLVCDGKKPGEGVRAVFEVMKKQLPKSFEDQYLREAFHWVIDWVAKEEPIHIAEKIIGGLDV